MDTDPFLHHLSDSQRRSAAAENLFSLFRSMSAMPGFESKETSEICLHRAFPINPMFHGVWRPRLTESNAGKAIDEAVTWHQEREASLIFWFNDHLTTPFDLGELLMERGFLSFEVDAPCMVADLSEIDRSLLDRVPVGFSIERVADSAGADAFSRGFAEAYGLPAWAGKSWADATKSIGADVSPWRMYVGWLDGRPVAVNMLLLGGGVAGLYAVGVLPELRGRGIGTAITILPLLDARDAGCQFGALFSSEIGKPVYERVGFRDTGARISRYLWIAPGLSFDQIS